MIKYLKHNALRDYQVFDYKIKKGDKILKVFFNEHDIHRSRDGRTHLDIWGAKLRELEGILYNGKGQNRHKQFTGLQQVPIRRRQSNSGNRTSKHSQYK